MKIRKFDQLTTSEVKKINCIAQKRDGTDRQLTGYSYNEPDDLGFVTVRYEICSHNMSKREEDVVLCAYLPDRRRSFASNA